MRLIFCGTPEFAVPALETLCQGGYLPALVITQPDRARGRGQKISAPPVKLAALQAGLEVYQPIRFNSEECLDRLRQVQADLAVVVAYSAKIGATALAIPASGWLNLHPSLLPAYRGAAPLQWALLDGLPVTRNTTFFLNERWDAGPVCLQETLPLDTQARYGEIMPLFARRGADLLLRSVRLIEQGCAPRIPQDDSQATFAPLLRAEDSFLDWSQSALRIHNRIRALYPEPGVFACLKGKRIRIQQTRLHSAAASGLPGEVIQCDKQGLVIQTGEGGLEILELRPENRGSMKALDFINGARLRPGDRFENGGYCEPAPPATEPSPRESPPAGHDPD